MKPTAVGAIIPYWEMRNSPDEMIQTGDGIIFPLGGIVVLLCEIVPIEWEMKLLCFKIFPCHIIILLSTGYTKNFCHGLYLMVLAFTNITDVF